ncbi:MAG: hypothetical protein JWN73_2889 [Betaproteobacteria bacterium]|nr:hypothetical protein [Betaproteobacteria bacterium]
MFPKLYLLLICTMAALAVPVAAEGAGACGPEARDPDAALTACNKLIDGPAPLRGDALARAHAARGEAWGRKGEYARAIADMDAALAAHPRDAASLSLRGIFKHQSRDFEGAVADYSASLRIRADGDTYANRGETRLEQNDFAPALQDFKQAVEINPDVGGYYLRRSLAWRGLGQYGRAVQDSDAAIAHPPASAQTFCDRGIANFYDGRFGDAIPDLEKCPQDDENYGYMQIWRYIAQVRSAGDSPGFRGELEASRFLGRAWPGPVREMLLGRITPEALLVVATISADPVKSAGRDCEASFYAGELQLTRGETGAARLSLTAALGKCSPGFLEYQGAVAELKRMGGS